jgi:polyhydroxyalkanoate synthesis regulator phasin
MSISKTFHLKLEGALTTSFFAFQDFELTIFNNSGYVKLTIQYTYIPEYKFIGIIYKTSDKFEAEYTPGAVTSNQIVKDLSEYNFFTTIGTWLGNITSEVKSTPLARELNKQEEILETFKARIEDLENGDDFFSKSEGEDLKSRLNDLEGLIASKFSENIDDEKKLEKDIRNLHKEIEALKLQVDAFSKKNWYLSFSTKLYLWFKNNPVSIRQIAGMSRELLPEGAKDVLSDDALDLLLLPNEGSNIDTKRKPQ